MLIGQQITILGAGIAGLSCAIAFAQRGASVRVFEQADAISEVGAGIQISPNGFNVLKALGLGDLAVALGTRARSISLCDYGVGRQVLKLDLAKHAPDLTYLYFYRPDLIDMLEKAARDVGVNIELGRKVAACVDTPLGTEVQFADGTSETCQTLIGADGLHSTVRPLLNTPSEPFFTGQVAWRATVPASNNDPSDVMLYMAPKRHLICYPLRNGELINIVAVQERSEWAQEGWHCRGDADLLRSEFQDFPAHIRQLLGRVKTTNLWGLFRHPVANQWFGTHAALIGDAAHPTLPFLAQGANMALEDAFVLADCLATLPQDEAFQAYQNRRHARVSKVIAAANSNAKNYHLQNPLIRFAAHNALRLGGKIAPQMAVSQFDWIYRHDVTC